MGRRNTYIRQLNTYLIKVIKREGISVSSLFLHLNVGEKLLLDFLFASDCGGEISYKTCKKIYDLINNIDFGNEIFTYGAHSDGKDYEYFKEFLLECYSHRRKMR